MIYVSVGDNDGHAGGEGGKLIPGENGLIVGFVDDAAGAVEVDFGAVNAAVFAKLDGDRSIGGVGGESKRHFQIAGDTRGIVTIAVVGEKISGGFS